jgi:hypothetical protein
MKNNDLTRKPTFLNASPKIFPNHTAISEKINNYINQLVTQTAGLRSGIQFMAHPDPWESQHKNKPACCFPHTYQLFLMPEKDTLLQIMQTNYGTSTNSHKSYKHY